MSTENLHLVVPGLLTLPDGLHGKHSIRAPLVEKLLGWSAESPGADDYEHQLFRLMGLPDDTAPAPYALLGDGGEPGDHIWIQADPVHMKADLTRLLLFEGRNLDIKQDEAETLAREFNAHFADRGMELFAQHAERWYLRLKEQPSIKTFPVSKVSGRSPDAFLPRGEDSDEWRSLLTEAQMLFHNSPVNKVREEHGHLSINGLWIHGPGSRAERLDPVAHFKVVVADDPLALGLAKAAGAIETEIGKAIHADTLCVLHAFHHAEMAADEHAWKEALNGFDEWLGRVFGWIKEKRGRVVKLYPCNGKSYLMDGRKSRRFWHRLPPLSHYLKF